MKENKELKGKQVEYYNERQGKTYFGTIEFARDEEPFNAVILGDCGSPYKFIAPIKDLIIR